jgi:hypothetical protein
LGLGIGDAGEVFETHERNSSPVDNKLAGISGTDPDHQYDVDVNIVLEQGSALLVGRTGKSNYVCSLEHCTQIRSVGERSELHYVFEVWAVRVENVVMPVGFQKPSVCLEVPVVGSDAISAIEYRKEIR